MTLSAAWWAHANWPKWWELILLGSSVSAWLIATFGARFGLASIAERAYAATVTFSVGGWLTLATVLGPFTPPLPQILGIGTLILAVPWWAHRRRRAKVRVERKLAAWPDIARTIGLIGSEVMSATVDVWGWRARFRLARGQTITDVTNRIPAIESSLGTYRGSVRVYPTPDDLANRFELRVRRHRPSRRCDSLARPVGQVNNGTNRARAIRGCHPMPRAFPATPRNIRRNNRLRKERRPKCPTRQPHRMLRCHYLGYRSQARNGTRPVA